MKIKWETVVTATLVLCALVTTGLVIRREAFTMRANRGEARSWQLIPHWQDYLDVGTRVGPARAKVQIIEFADFECPFCGSFHQTIRSIQNRYPGKVSLTYIHFPLMMHRFAIPAARMAECAGQQGRFEAMYDQLFDGQQNFGLKPWSEFAQAAGVPDLETFDTCAKGTDSMPQVERGRELGNKLDIRGTPTIIINGWKLEPPPNAEELDQMVQRVLADKDPTDRKS